MIDVYDKQDQMTAMKRCTSIPAASVAFLLATGSIPGGGAAPPERVVPPDVYRDMLAERGLNIEEWWYDGWGEVTDLYGAEYQEP